VGGCLGAAYAHRMLPMCLLQETMLGMKKPGRSGADHAGSVGDIAGHWRRRSADGKRQRSSAATTRCWWEREASLVFARGTSNLSATHVTVGDTIKRIVSLAAQEQKDSVDSACLRIA
jgi:hypothetical protein